MIEGKREEEDEEEEEQEERWACRCSPFFPERVESLGLQRRVRLLVSAAGPPPPAAAP